MDSTDDKTWAQGMTEGRYGYFACFFERETGFDGRQEFQEFLRVSMLGDIEAASALGDAASEFSAKHVREISECVFETARELRAELRAADAEDAGEGVDDEVDAIRRVMGSLLGLSVGARERVLDYVQSRLDSDMDEAEFGDEVASHG